MHNKEPLDFNQSDELRKSNLFALYQKHHESDPLEADLFKAVFLYKVYSKFPNLSLIYV